MKDFVRRNYLFILLILSVAIPYTLMADSTKPVRDKIRAALVSQADDLDSIEGIDDPQVSRLLAMQKKISSSQRLEKDAANLTPTISLESVLRFDISPRWVMQHWPHVSTTRTDGPLDGLRVPVITGTTPRDLVGSLTYYFDEQQRVQRISLDGIIGDDRHLVSAVTRRFQLKPELKPGVGIYALRWNGKPVSVLWIRRMPVADREKGGPQHEFSLELNRPDNYQGLSPRMQQLIQNAYAGHGGGVSFRRAVAG